MPEVLYRRRIHGGNNSLRRSDNRQFLEIARRHLREPSAQLLRTSAIGERAARWSASSIPAYNRAFCVVDAIESVLAQSHTNVECVVVDDGSTDDTAAIVTRRVPRRAPRVGLRADHGGVSAARNRGLARRQGDVVTFLDSDDLMVPERLSWQLEHWRRTTSMPWSVVSSRCSSGDVSRPAWLAAHPEWWDGYYHMSILCTPLELVRSVGGFDEQLEVGEDIDWVVRLAGAGRAHRAARPGRRDPPLLRRQPDATASGPRGLGACGTPCAVTSPVGDRPGHDVER